MTGRGARRGPRPRDDEGFTLVELMVVLVAFAVLLAITVPVVSTVMQTTSQVRNTYTNLDSQLSLSTTLQQLLRAAVAPAPTTDTTLTSPFLAGSVTPTSLAFYANTGTTTRGPEKVVASCTQTATDKTLCTPTATFELTLTQAETGTCPFKETTTTPCVYTTVDSSPTTKTLLVIHHVTNGDSATPEPLFTYSYTSSSGTKTVCSAGTPTGCSGSDSVTFAAANCKKSSTPTSEHPFTTCPAGEIDEVYYTLEFDAKVTSTQKAQATPRNGGLQAQTVSGTFVMSSTSTLYSPVVG